MENALMSAHVINIGADPAFAAIRKYKAAFGAFNRCRGPNDDEITKKLESAFCAAEDEFLNIVPTTLEGFKTKICVFLNEYEGCGANEEAMEGFLDTLYKSACAIAGKAVQS
jgi:hypothetical protein